MKKGLFKILAATTAASLLLSMSMSAMAATYFTTTTYVTPQEGETATVTATTTVYAANDDIAVGDEVAYLVYKETDAADGSEDGQTDGNIQDSEIVYIDQQAYSAGMTFTFETALANAEDIGSTVRLGSTSLGWSESNYGLDTTNGGADAKRNVVIDEYTVTYSGSNCYVIVDETGTELIDTDAAEAATADAYAGQELTFYVLPATGYTIAGATVTATPTDADMPAAPNALVTGQGYATYKYTPVADTTLTFACTTQVTGTTPTATLTSATYAETLASASEDDDVTADTKVLTAIGTATGATECGIIFSSDETKLNNVAALTGAELKAALAERDGETYVRKLKALGVGSDGSFTIKVEDVKGAIDSGAYAETATTLHVKTYAIIGDNVALSTDTIAATIQ